MNIPATLSALKLLRKPTLCLPHLTVSTFADLPLPISPSLHAHADIRAVVLDKDNCFALPGRNEVWKPFQRIDDQGEQDKFNELRAAYPGDRLLIVSNSAGTRDDPGGREKPNASSAILAHFAACPATQDVTDPAHIAVVGDRLFTDVMMANMMGSWAVWVRDGVRPGESGAVSLVHHLTLGYGFIWDGATDILGMTVCGAGAALGRFFDAEGIYAGSAEPRGRALNVGVFHVGEPG
ncbi:MAG: hypothetical protein M1833_001494 [Piccolia ochrophora]|nr:MAG: hypothetical protein M1833_001494 [Piccolia ochrophora]